MTRAPLPWDRRGRLSGAGCAEERLRGRCVCRGGGPVRPGLLGWPPGASLEGKETPGPLGQRPWCTRSKAPAGSGPDLPGGLGGRAEPRVYAARPLLGPRGDSSGQRTMGISKRREGFRIASFLEAVLRGVQGHSLELLEATPETGQVSVPLFVPRVLWEPQRCFYSPSPRQHALLLAPHATVSLGTRVLTWGRCSPPAASSSDPLAEPNTHSSLWS